MPKIEKTDAEWRSQLDETQYRVTRQKGTERAFTGQYWDCHILMEPIAASAVALHFFVREAKFDSGCGWPSFHTPNEASLIDEHTDRSVGMIRC